MAHIVGSWFAPVYRDPGIVTQHGGNWAPRDQFLNLGSASVNIAGQFFKTCC